MNSLKDLHLLIKSFHKQEKKYINLEVKKAGTQETNYFTLYKILERTSDFQENKLMAKISKSNLDNNLSYLQNYLYDLLLSILRKARIEKDVTQVIKNQIEDATYLYYNKNLPKQALKSLQKAKRTAKKYEKYVELENCLDIELNLSLVVKTEKGIKKKRSLLRTEIDKVNQQKRLLRKIGELKIEQIDLMGKGVNRRNEAELKKYEAIEKNITDEDLVLLNGFRLKRAYLTLRSNSLLLQGRFEDDDIIQKKVFILSNQYSHIIESNPSLYAKTCLNYVMSLIRNNHITEVPSVLKEVEEISKRYAKANNNQFHYLYNEIRIPSVKLRYYLKSHQWELVSKMIQYSPGFLEKMMERESHQLFAENYIFPIAYFYLGDIPKAMIWLNDLLNVPPSSILNDDIYTKLKMLEIVCHYEIENFALIPNLVLSLKRYLDKTNRFFMIEKWFVTLFKNNDAYISIAKRDFFEAQKEDLIDIIENNHFEQLELENINWLAWVNTKINQSLMTVELQKLES